MSLEEQKPVRKDFSLARAQMERGPIRMSRIGLSARAELGEVKAEDPFLRRSMRNHQAFARKQARRPE